MNSTKSSSAFDSDTQMIHCVLGAEGQGWELRTTWGHGAANMPIYVQFFSESTRNFPPKGHLCSSVSQEGFNSWVTGKLEPRVWLFWGNSKYKQGYLFFSLLDIYLCSRRYGLHLILLGYSLTFRIQGENNNLLFFWECLKKTSQATLNLRWVC